MPPLRMTRKIVIAAKPRAGHAPMGVLMGRKLMEKHGF